MARLLPCKWCRGPATLPGGHQYYVGRVSDFPFRYECATCKRVTTISVVAFNSIPEEEMPPQPAGRVLVKPDLLREASSEKFVPPKTD